mmetsp:Transcript_43978/g.95555  ORF Transcript_43978/g.95555 Transcript_43978/m.95555 type:complete len:222 (+) Transcript_43978:556-1221(+)
MQLLAPRGNSMRRSKPKTGGLLGHTLPTAIGQALQFSPLTGLLVSAAPAMKEAMDFKVCLPHAEGRHVLRKPPPLLGIGRPALECRLQKAKEKMLCLLTSQTQQLPGVRLDPRLLKELEDHTSLGETTALLVARIDQCSHSLLLVDIVLPSPKRAARMLQLSSLLQHLGAAEEGCSLVPPVQRSAATIQHHGVAPLLRDLIAFAAGVQETDPRVPRGLHAD